MSKSISTHFNAVPSHSYCDDERPSRIDFAMMKYGGPFTTEQVEALFRILTLLLSLGATFTMKIPTSDIGFIIFGRHTGYREDFLGRCTIWAILESSILQYIIGSIILPIYIYIIFALIGRHISMFTRLYTGLILYMLGTVSMLAIDLAVHLDDLGTSSHCMFT